jgi:hypothetical protein
LIQNWRRLPKHLGNFIRGRRSHAHNARQLGNLYERVYVFTNDDLQSIEFDPTDDDWAGQRHHRLEFFIRESEVGLNYHE